MNVRFDKWSNYGVGILKGGAFTSSASEEITKNTQREISDPTLGADYARQHTKRNKIMRYLLVRNHDELP